MKKQVGITLSMLLATSNIIHACLNTISNNTNTTYKIIEITKDNPGIKKEIFLPKEYLNDEHKAHTIAPGEECAFGGHYVPTFAIFKKYPDDRWHNLLIVKQTRCGPRGPENKYLLLTDLLRRNLPSDYQDVYKFTIKKEPHEIEDESVNKKELTSIANEYQVLLNQIDDLTQKVQELMSRQLSENAKHTDKKGKSESQHHEPTIGETEDGASCNKCKLPA